MISRLFSETRSNKLQKRMLPHDVSKFPAVNTAEVASRRTKVSSSEKTAIPVTTMANSLIYYGVKHRYFFPTVGLLEAYYNTLLL